MKLKSKHIVAFGFGAFGKDMVYMLISAYLMYYYNVVLGVSSAFIGTVMMLARIFDAINDPLMGMVVAKTKTKWGKFRPWIFAGTVLNSLTIYALYSTPDSLSGPQQKNWLVVFYVAWGVTYTLMDIPFWSMIPAITKPGSDREMLSSIARTCSGVGAALPTVLTMVMVPLLSASDVIADYKIGFKWWAIIISLIFLISEIVCVMVVSEKVVENDTKSLTIRDMIRSVVSNDQALIVVFSIIFVYTSINICGNLIIYFFQFDVGSGFAYSVFTAVAFIAQVIIMLCIPLLRRYFSKRKLFTIGFVFQILGYAFILLLIFTNVYSPKIWPVLCISGAIIYFGYGLVNVILTIFLSDTVDYGQLKNGTREESVIFSMQTFSVKLSAGIAVFVAGLVLDRIKFDTDAKVQSAATLSQLRLWMTIPSVCLLVCGLILFIFKYKLDEKMMEEINNKLEENQ